MTQSPPTGELVARAREATSAEAHEARMNKWDHVRKLVADGSKASLPRDIIESEFDCLEEELREAASCITTLERELEEARKKAGKLHDYANMRDWQVTALTEALEPFTREKMPSLKLTELAYNSWGLRCLMSPMAIARQKAIAVLREQRDGQAAALHVEESKT